MKLDKYCPNRIKPRLLREQKTEALLVFIRTILEESIEENDILQITSKKDAKVIHDVLLNLLEQLQNCVVNAEYLQYVRINSNHNQAFNILATKESPLITYYNSLSTSIVKLIPVGVTWIPELLVISLLSEWILEEEKFISMYPFLKDIDFIKLISIFDKARIDIKKIDTKRYEFENGVLMNMYKVSNRLIYNLKKSKFKANNYKNSKRR